MEICHKICIDYLSNTFIGIILVLLLIFSIIIYIGHTKFKIFGDFLNDLFRFLNILYLNRIKVAVFGLFFGFLSGIIGNLLAENKLKSIFDLNINALSKLNQSISNTVSYFTLNAPNVSNTNVWIWISYITIALIVSIGAITLFLRTLLEKNLAKSFMLKNNIMIFGYGNISKSFLTNYLKTNKKNINLIVFDNEKDNIDDIFYTKGIIYIKEDIKNEKFFEYVNFENTTHILLSMQDDKQNLDLAVKIIDKLKNKKKSTTLIMHLKNFNLMSVFFDDEFIKHGKDYINLRIFSYPTEVVDDLFLKFKEKLFPDLNNKIFKIAVVGDSPTAQEIIKRIMINFIFDKKINIQIYIISTKKFFEETKVLLNYNKEKFPYVELIHKNYSTNLIKNKNFWNGMNNVFITYDDENQTLDFVFKLYKYVFSTLNNINPNIFFNIYNEHVLGEKINQIKSNYSTFNKFYAFGLGKDLFTVEKILNDEELYIAKLIHCGYQSGRFNEECLKNWYKIENLYDKLQNIAQYYHIDVKLYVLGLKREKTEKTEKLEEENKKIFFEYLEKYINDKNIIKTIQENYYDSKKLLISLKKWTFDEKNQKIINLLNLEHKRWMSYHFLEGWEYDDNKQKNIKKHNCLIDILEFKNEKIKNTIIYDFQSIIYIPVYLSKANYKIVPL